MQQSMVTKWLQVNRFSNYFKVIPAYSQVNLLSNSKISNLHIEHCGSCDVIWAKEGLFTRNVFFSLCQLLQNIIALAL